MFSDNANKGFQDTMESSDWAKGSTRASESSTSRLLEEERPKYRMYKVNMIFDICIFLSQKTVISFMYSAPFRCNDPFTALLLYSTADLEWFLDKVL